MLNKALLIGRLGKDPELRTSQSGKQFCSFTVATDNGYGEKKTTDWHNVVCFDKCAEACGKYLKKGSPVYVEGRISYDKYTDKNGVEKISTRIVASTVDFLPKQSGDKTAPLDKTNADPNYNPFAGDTNSFSTPAEVFDDVPF